MTTMSLADLRAHALERADMVNTSFVSTSELDAIINGEGAELHDLVVTLFEDQFTTEFSFTLGAGVSTLALSSLPAGAPFYKLRGVDRSDGSDWFTLRRFEWASRNDGRTQTSVRPRDVRYRLVGASLRLSPDASAQGDYRLQYIPGYVNLVAPSDVLDYPEQWVEYVLAGTAAKLLAKEESDPGVQLSLKSAMRARIEKMGVNRDAAGPERVERIRDRDRYGDGDDWDD